MHVRVDSRSEDAGSDRGLARTSIVLRVPVAKLDGVVRELRTLGAVQTAETRSEDVTAQRVDMDARIKALQTSVDRLLAIMRDALGDRIDYSTVDVTFVAETIGGPAPKEYQGVLAATTARPATERTRHEGQDHACDFHFGGLEFYVGQAKPAKLGCYEGASKFDAPGLKTLDYGQTYSHGAITCNSELSGVTCTDTSTGHYFGVSRENYELE